MSDHGAPTPDRTARAAQELSGDDTLLPGEDRSIASDRLDDAIHWTNVYEELFRFKHQLLATLNDQRAAVDADGLREVENDEVVLTRQADRLARRLQFWRQESQRRGSTDAG